MSTILRFIGILAMLGISQGAFAQSSTFFLHLNKLDNRTARIYGPGGVDETFSTKNNFEVVLQHDANYTLEINPNHLVASLELIVNRYGQFESIRWQDADGSQTGGTTQPLPTTYYSLSQPQTLTLFAAQVQLDYQQADVGTVYLPEIWLGEIDQAVSSLSLFPGDYELVPGNASNGVGLCYLDCEILAGSGNWDSAIGWRVFRPMPGGNSLWKPLDPYFYDLSNPNELNLIGKEIYLDKQIDNPHYYFHSLSLSGSGNQTLKLFPGNLDVGIGLGEELTAYLSMKMDMDLGHIEDAVYWLDPDSSQTPGLSLLDPGFVVKIGDTLRIAGLVSQMDLTASDNEIILLQLGDFNLGMGYQELELFPGNYDIKVANTATRITFEVLPSGRLSSKLRYYDYYDPSVPEDELWKVCYTLSEDSLRLRGSAIQVDLSAISGDEYAFIQLAEGKPQPSPGNTTSLNLLPSGYMVDITPEGESDPHYRGFVRFGNAPEGLVSPMYWKDLTLGGNPYAPEHIYDPHLAWVSQGKLALYGRPNQIVTPYTTVYPMLERKPDGEWLHVVDRTLRFQYTGRYDAGPLSFRLMNWKREDINLTQPLNLSLNKEHGDNRFVLALPASVGMGQYVLEVTTEKNETYYLRFEVQ